MTSFWHKVEPLYDYRSTRAKDRTLPDCIKGWTRESECPLRRDYMLERWRWRQMWKIDVWQLKDKIRYKRCDRHLLCLCFVYLCWMLLCFFIIYVICVKFGFTVISSGSGLLSIKTNNQFRLQTTPFCSVTENYIDFFDIMI